MSSFQSHHYPDNTDKTSASIARFPWTTTCIILINSIIYIATAIIYNGGWSLPVSSLIDTGANFSGLTLDKGWWRLFTSIFLHGNLLHLLVNSYSLFVIGRLIEPVLGHFRFLGYYLLFGVAGSIVSLTGYEYTVSVGASGAIFGLFGFYLIHLLSSSKQPLIQNAAFRSVLFSLVINFIVGFALPYIDNAAHLGGAIAGLICSFIIALSGRTRDVSHPVIKNYLFTGLITTFSVFYFILYQSFSRDRVAYYHFFVDLVSTETEALRLENGSFTQPFYKANLNAAYILWSDIHKQLRALQQSKNTSAAEDRLILNRYIELRKEGINFYKKMIDYGSFIFLDSVEQIRSEIEQLPKIKYTLNFYPVPKDKDSLENKELMFDKDWNITNNTKEKMYTRKFKSDKLGRTQGWAFDYYPDGTLQMKADFHNNVQNGIAFYYYPNGVCKSLGLMLDGDRMGKWQYFYKTRTLRSEILYDSGNRPKMIAAFDSTGTQLVFDGNGTVRDYNEDENIIEEGTYKNYYKDGIWYGYYRDGSPFYKEIYKDGEFIRGESVSPDNVRYHYKSTVEYPEPVTGWEKYKFYIDSSLVNSSPASSKGIVSIRLFIDSTGNIKSMNPILIIGSHCEDTLMNIIKQGPSFNPGKRRGQVKSMRTYIYGLF